MPSEAARTGGALASQAVSLLAGSVPHVMAPGLLVAGMLDQLSQHATNLSSAHVAVGNLRRSLESEAEERARVINHLRELEALLDGAILRLGGPPATADAQTNNPQANSASHKVAERSEHRLMSEVSPADPAWTLRAAPWQPCAVAVLQEAGPLHYSALYQRITSLGVVVGGRNPEGTLVALLSRDSAFQRVGRGMYWLAGQPRPAITVPPARRRRRVSRAKPRTPV